MAQAPTLLTSPTATITFDGLIIFAYNEETRVCQARIHTQAENHELTLNVKEQPQPEDVDDPAKKITWDGSHITVRAIAPLWLYVDSGNGRRPEDFSAALHRPSDKRFSQSFGHILDFEALYNRRLTFNPSAFSLLNIADGIFYSAQNAPTQLLQFGQNGPFNINHAERGKKLIVSSLAAVDIDAVSDPSVSGGQPPVERFLVLEQENPRVEIFRRKLEEGKRYVIQFVNGPKKVEPNAEQPEHPEHGEGSGMGHGVGGGTHPTSHEGHFLQFYEMFSLLPDEMKFLVDHIPVGDETPDAPPCNVGQAGSSGGSS